MDAVSFKITLGIMITLGVALVFVVSLMVYFYCVDAWLVWRYENATPVTVIDHRTQIQDDVPVRRAAVEMVFIVVIQPDDAAACGCKVIDLFPSTTGRVRPFVRDTSACRSPQSWICSSWV
jgi:hypothetical protein